MAFIDNLYFGLGYEYHAAGHLWRLGMEAYKMDADFGFDLLAYNQAQRSFKSIDQRKPYLFQVKAARVHNWEPYNSNGGKRYWSEVNFFLNKQHLDTLVREPDSYGIFYIIERNKNKVEEIVSYFWLSNEHLKFLYDGKAIDSDDKWTWFIPDKKDPEKKVCLRAKIFTYADPKEIVKDNFENLHRKIEKMEDGTVKNEMLELHNELNEWLDKIVLRNNNTHTYVKLYATNSNKEDIYNMLSSNLHELSNFEKQSKLFEDQETNKQI